RQPERRHRQRAGGADHGHAGELVVRVLRHDRAPDPARDEAEILTFCLVRSQRVPRWLSCVCMEFRMTIKHIVRVARIALAASLMTGLAATPGQAQTIRGTLTGTVTDSTGGVIPGATVTVTNVATAISETAVTNQQGVYTL